MKKCRRCGYETTDSTNLDGTAGVPSPGDISICLKCGVLSKFSPSMTLEPLTNEDLYELQQTEAWKDIVNLKLLHHEVFQSNLRTKKAGNN